MADFPNPYSGFAQGLTSGAQLGAQFGDMFNQRFSRAIQLERFRQEQQDRNLKFNTAMEGRILEALNEQDPKIRDAYFDTIFKASEDYTHQKVGPVMRKFMKDPEQAKLIVNAAKDNGLTLTDILGFQSDPMQLMTALGALSKYKQQQAEEATFGGNPVPQTAEAESGPNAVQIGMQQRRVQFLNDTLEKAKASGVGPAGLERIQNRVKVEEDRLFDLLKQGGQAATAEAAKPVPETLFKSALADEHAGKLPANTVYPGMTYGELRDAYAATRASKTAPIDLSRPVIQNPDGSISTERTITVGLGGKFYVIPTIVGGQQLAPGDAIKAYLGGQNPAVGEFATQAEADKYAQQRSKQIGVARGVSQPQSSMFETTDKAAITPLPNVGPIKQTGKYVAPPTTPAAAKPQIWGGAGGTTGAGAMDERQAVVFREQQQLRASKPPDWAIADGFTSMGQLTDAIQAGKYTPPSEAEQARRRAAAADVEQQYGKKFLDYQTKGEAARIERAQLQAMYSLLNRAGETGPMLTNIRGGVNNLVNTLTGGKVTPEGMDELKMMEQFSNQMALQSQVLLKGSTSDADFVRMTQSNPNLFTTRRANQLMILYRMQVAKLMEHRSEAAQQWVNKFGSLSRTRNDGKNFDQVWDEFVSKPENSAVGLMARNLQLPSIDAVYDTLGAPRPEKK